MRKLYEMTENLNLNDKLSEGQKLNKIMDIVRSWHFSLFPKYDFDYFLSKVADLGQKPAGRAFMSRIRKVYKKEDTFEEIFKDQLKLTNVGKTEKLQGNDITKDLSDNGARNLKEIEKKLEPSISSLNITIPIRVSKDIPKNNMEDEILYDKNFILEQDNKDDEVDNFYANMGEQFYENENSNKPVQTQKLAFVDQTTENNEYEEENTYDSMKKRGFTEAYETATGNDGVSLIQDSRKYKAK